MAAPWALALYTAPAVEPLSVSDAAAHLRVDGTSDEQLIESLILAARRYCEGASGRSLVTQTWELQLDGWPCGDAIRLPRPPLQSVTSVTTYDSTGAAAVFAAANYLVDTRSQPGRLVLGYGKSWPSTVLRPAAGVVVRYVAGYGLAAAVPETYKQAMQLLVGHWYEHREAAPAGALSREIEFAVSALLHLDRIWPFEPAP